MTDPLTDCKQPNVRYPEEPCDLARPCVYHDTPDPLTEGQRSVEDIARDLLQPIYFHLPSTEAWIDRLRAVTAALRSEREARSRSESRVEGLRARIAELEEALDAADECTWHHSGCPCFPPEDYEQSECNCLFADVDRIVRAARRVLDSKGEKA